MATIRPFLGLRFKASGNDLSLIVAPPYDVISPEQRESFAGQHEHNVVRLTLPEQHADDRSKYIKYARSASRLEEWRRENVVELEDAPSYYRYSQTFAVPGSEESFTRTKLIATIKVEPYSNKVVLPHEQTFPKHKEDRLRILEATRSHLECIFGLYEDDSQSIHNLVVNSSAELLADFVTEEDGIRHVFEQISDQATCQAITDSMAAKSVWIADGHHRYETALAFREALGERDGSVPEDYMMMALCSISDPGLVLLPTHRILKKMPIDTSGLKDRLQEQFELTEESHESLMHTIERMNSTGERAFGIALSDGTGLIAKVKNLNHIVAQMEGAGSDELKQLDVSILHSYIFEKLLGLTGHDFFTYTRIEDEALASVKKGAPAAFLMNPPTVEDMRTIALGGDFMPQKSTYYYPKLLSGLVMWSLKDFSL